MGKPSEELPVDCSDFKRGHNICLSWFLNKANMMKWNQLFRLVFLDYQEGEGVKQRDNGVKVVRLGVLAATVDRLDLLFFY